jgi:hypothetical protein
MFGFQGLFFSLFYFIAYVDSNYRAYLYKTRSLVSYVFTVGGCAVS